MASNDWQGLSQEQKIERLAEILNQHALKREELEQRLAAAEAEIERMKRWEPRTLDGKPA